MYMLAVATSVQDATLTLLQHLQRQWLRTNIQVSLANITHFSCNKPQGKVLHIFTMVQISRRHIGRSGLYLKRPGTY